MKKNTETVESAAPSVIAVDARKLSLGLKMTFEGMAMVFDSLGVDVTRQMLKQRYGRIINLSSVVGIFGNAGQVNYAASKAGIIGMTKSAARELGSREITVNAIAPGFIQTDMTDSLSDDMKNQMLGAISLGSFGKVEDIAYTAAFLASDRARYITGQVIQVDGGIRM